MKNKGFIVVLVFLWEWLVVLVANDLSITNSGINQTDIPQSGNILDNVGEMLDMFMNLLTFNVSGIPDLVVFFVVYIPLLILFIAIIMMVRGD